jgi:hypothetical protein
LQAFLTFLGKVADRDLIGLMILQKVSAQLEASRPAPQVVNNP